MQGKLLIQTSTFGKKRVPARRGRRPNDLALQGGKKSSLRKWEKKKSHEKKKIKGSS